MAKERYVIVAHAYDKRGRLISCATNNYEKTHPLQAYYAEKVGHPERQFLHAEILAGIRAKGRQIHTLKVWRYGANGQLLCAKPCAICQEVCKTEFFIPNIWYSDHGTMVKLGKEMKY